MKLFRGLERTDYQDILRAIGLLLDERRYRNFRLVEHEDGVIVQAMPAPGGRLGARYETFLLTDAEIEKLLRRAYERRTAGRSTGAALATPTPDHR